MKSERIRFTESHEIYQSRISCLINNLYQHGETIHEGRNLIKKVSIPQIERESLEVVIKSFAVPSKLKGLVYANFQESKAWRSMQNAVLLRELEILTPEPIACIEYLKFNCLRESYYICHYWPHNIDLFSLMFRNLPTRTESLNLLIELANFSVELHNKGILHLDYNPGNILVRAKEGCFNFALVDLNRIRFTNLDLQDRIQGLIRLTIKPDTIEIIGQRYAKAFGIDSKQFCLKLGKEHKKFWSRRTRLEKIMRILKRPSP